MPYFTSPNERIIAPLPRKDILAVCAFLNRRPATRAIAPADGPETVLDRLAAAATEARRRCTNAVAALQGATYDEDDGW